MAKTTRIPTYTVLLPPTPCTPQMRSHLIEAATELNISIAEAQRRAIALFLSTTYSNAKSDSNARAI